MSTNPINGIKRTRDTFLPPFKHSIGKEEINEVIDTLESDWITTGPKTFKFEEMFGKRWIQNIQLQSILVQLHYI